ncbi:hypothetical protein Y695_03309 [Hydrogenophaga sp. T4]|nr:hypothetical protein Y695_03309 [Hydrogenophaga sp. T4]
MPFRSAALFSGFLLYTPCGGHGTANKTIMPCSASFFSSTGRCTFQSLAASS